MDVARLNFSHGTHHGHGRAIRLVREMAAKYGRTIPILQDLQGPKIRIGQVHENGVLLQQGRHLVLTTRPLQMGNEKRVFVDYSGLPEMVSPGGRILVDDGNIELEVLHADSTDVETRVVVGGPLRSRKGVNLPHVKTKAPALTEKDIEDLEFGLENDVDLIALSFVRSEEDVASLMRRVQVSGKKVGVIAKIEKPEALLDLDQILQEADGIMVARGDLGIEMPLWEVPLTQKDIIGTCLIAAKPVITATQMLESMIENPRPTRAEASDVANAVLDGSDAVMLSGETAAGKFPIRAVKIMDEIIRSAETRQGFNRPPSPSDGAQSREPVTRAISYTATHIAQKVEAAAIVCLTHSGATARHIASHRPDVPLYAFTDDERVVARLGVLWGTTGFYMPFQRDTDAGVRMVHRMLTEADVAHPGDRIVITAGMPLPEMGRTNMVHVSRV
jgi:pyruvate kinase